MPVSLYGVVWNSIEVHSDFIFSRAFLKEYSLLAVAEIEEMAWEENGGQVILNDSLM